MPFIAAYHLLQQGYVEAPPCHSSKCDEAFGIRAQVGGALLHGFLDAAGNGSLLCSALPGSINKRQLSCCHERLEEFFDEEGVSLGAKIERVEKISINLLLRT